MKENINIYIYIYIYIRFFLKTNGLLVENSKFVMPITNVVIVVVVVVIIIIC